MPITLRTLIHSREYNKPPRGGVMKSRTLFILMMLSLLLTSSARGLIDRSSGEGGDAARQGADRPFKPLEATLDVAQGSMPPEPLEDSREETPSSIQPALSGDLESAISSVVDALLSAINIRRALDGWHPLIIQAPLTEIANQRAIDMSVHGYLGHEDPETEENYAKTMLEEHGYFGNVAELVYAASVPLDSLTEIAIDEWFDDPDTRAVLLSPGFRFIGIGIMGDGTTWKIVQILAESGP